MGNICNGNHEREQGKQMPQNLSKNYPVSQFTLKNLFMVDLVLGTYRCHKGHLLLVLAQQQYLEYNSELRDYSHNFSAVLDAATIDRKKMIAVSLTRNCPYKALQLCVLPPYSSENRETYVRQFQNMMHEALLLSNDITIQICHTSENSNGVPNQTLMGIFLQNLMAGMNKELKLTIISSQAKLLNMIRFEIIKLQDFTAIRMPSVKQTN